MNELGHPVVFPVMYFHADQYGNENRLVGVVATFAEAEKAEGGYHRAYEHDMETGTLTSVSFMQKNRKKKAALLSLYKSGAKRKAFESLDIRADLTQQLDFPIYRELEKMHDALKK